MTSLGDIIGKQKTRCKNSNTQKLHKGRITTRTERTNQGRTMRHKRQQNATNIVVSARLFHSKKIIASQDEEKNIDTKSKRIGHANNRKKGGTY